MKLSDFLIPVLFMAVIVYRVYRKKKNIKETKEKNANVNTEEKEQDNATFDTTPIHRVFVQPVDFDKLEDSKKVAVSVETVIEDYLADIDRMGALKPTNIKFFTNYNRIFIVYLWS